MDLYSNEEKFKSPCSILLAGPTCCGKTTWVIKLVKNAKEMFETTPTRIVYHYAEYQPVFDDMSKHVELCQGLPNLEELRSDGHTLCIVDDMMDEASKNDVVTKMATRFCHHANVTLVFLTQNLFQKNQRTARINMTYLVLFKNPADKSQIMYLARQMYPSTSQALTEAYTDATERSHGYLIVDLSQDCREERRLRTNIFPDESPTFVYVPHK